MPSGFTEVGDFRLTPSCPMALWVLGAGLEDSRDKSNFEFDLELDTSGTVDDLVTPLKTSWPSAG